MALLKTTSSYSEVIKAIVFFSLAALALQFLVNETFAALATPPVNENQIREELRINMQPLGIGNDLASAYYNQGLRFLDVGRLQEAIVAFEQAIAIKPDYEVAYFCLGTTYSQLELWGKAVDSFNKAVEISPEYAYSHLGLGIAYLMLSQVNEAVKALREAIRLNPAYAEAHYVLGISYLALGDQASVLEQHGILQDLNPNLANQLIHLIDK